MAEKYSEALSFAASICSASEQCASDIIRKTRKFELSEGEKEKLVSFLKEQGFINEERYVRFFINDKFRFNKWGKIKISYMLRQKGIDNFLIEKGLENINEEEYCRLLSELLAQKRKSIKNDGKAGLRTKLFRFAAGRGFETGLIFGCLKKMELDDCEESFE